MANPNNAWKSVSSWRFVEETQVMDYTGEDAAKAFKAKYPGTEYKVRKYWKSRNGVKRLFVAVYKAG